MSFFKNLKDDYQANNLISNNIIFTILRVLVTPKAWAITLIRLIVSEIVILSTISRFVCNMLFHIEIGANVSIGPRVFYPHPTGIVIATGSVIGSDCSIYQRVTLAEKGGIHKGPTIGNNCIIGTGTVIVGDLTVGGNVKIGPNSVVISDIESNVIAFGNPLTLKNRAIHKNE